MRVIVRALEWNFFLKKLGILKKSSPHCVTTAAGAPKPFSEETVSTNNQDPKYI